MQPVVVRGFAELRDAGITRTVYELHGLLLQVFFAVKTCTCMIVTVCCVSLHRPYTMNDWSILCWWVFCVVWQFTLTIQ